MNNGWIKLYRSLVEWEWWDDVNTMRLFVYCLIMANHDDVKWHGVTIPRGSFITSIERLARAIGKKTTIQQARTAINHLISTGEITSKSTNKGSIITICNYDKYQSSEKDEQQTKPQQNNNPITSEQQTNQQQINNKQEINNDNNEENVENVENNINNNPHSQARAREEALARGGVIGEVEKLAQEVRQEIQNNGSIVESALRLYGLTPQQLEEYLGWFVDKLTIDGTQFKSRSDFRMHFNNWLKIQIQQKINQQNNNNGNRPRNHQPQYSAEFLASIAADITSGH